MTPICKECGSVLPVSGQCSCRYRAMRASLLDLPAASSPAPRQDAPAPKKTSDEREDCPLCEGEGEVYQPTSVPEGEPWTMCMCCKGSGKMPTPDEIASLRIGAEADAHTAHHFKTELNAFRKAYPSLPHPFDLPTGPEAPEEGTPGADSDRDKGTATVAASQAVRLEAETVHPIQVLFDEAVQRDEDADDEHAPDCLYATDEATAEIVNTTMAYTIRRLRHFIGVVASDRDTDAAQAEPLRLTGYGEPRVNETTWDANEDSDGPPRLRTYVGIDVADGEARDTEIVLNVTRDNEDAARRDSAAIWNGITTAVNSHGALVAALTEMCAQCDGVSFEDPHIHYVEVKIDKRTIHDARYLLASLALASARGDVRASAQAGAGPDGESDCTTGTAGESPSQAVRPKDGEEVAPTNIRIGRVNERPPFSTPFGFWWGYEVSADGIEPFTVWLHNPRYYNNSEDGTGAEWSRDCLADGSHTEDGPIHPDWYFDELRQIVAEETYAGR